MPSAFAKKIGRWAALSAAGILLAPAAASACDCVRLSPDSPRFQADIDAIAAFYPVAAEGVIEADGPYGWRLRTTREFRGPKKGLYPVRLISDCSLAPGAMDALVGKTIFALLAEGPGDQKGNYELSRCINLQSPDVEKALREKMIAGCSSKQTSPRLERVY